MAVEERDEGGIGRGLPRPLSERIAAGSWLRTAHRGAPHVAPGNTRRSILAALDYGVDLVEIDLHHSADGRLVLWHDDAVPCQGRHLAIREHPFDELAAAVAEEFDEELVDLDGALGLADGRAGLMIDLKTQGLAEHISEVVKRGKFSPAVVCGEYWDDLRTVRELTPEVGISLTLDGQWSEAKGPRIATIDTPAVTVAWPLVNRGFVEQLHQRGIAVLVWTVDEVALMRRLLELGVDGLTSNRSDLFSTL